MKTYYLSVSSKENEYPVYITENGLDALGSLVKEVCAGKRAALISDTNVFPLYGEKIKDVLSSAGYAVSEFVFPAGESSKNTGILLDILSFLSSKGFDRHDVVVSLGGGVAGDVSGLASSLYMRGTKIVHLPTSLLACVDSCIGGKTAVNTEYGKNMIGTFYSPNLVFCDTSFLSTLPKDEYREGISEVIKYGVIRDARLFEKIKSKEISETEIIKTCLGIKKEFIEQDEYDNSSRRLLNFGHTFGHAVEKCSGYTVTHGKAVACGMVIASKIGEKLSVCPKSVTDEIISVLSSYGLPTECGIPYEEIASSCIGDKKSEGEYVSVVLPVKIGECVIKKYKKAELKGIVECI